eukprot:UN00959
MLKKQLAPYCKIPIKLLVLTLYDIELTAGTMEQNGVPDSCTMFISNVNDEAKIEETNGPSERVW